MLKGIDFPSEKQEEPHYTKRSALFDKCVENCPPEVMKEVSDEVDTLLGKEQKPLKEIWKEMRFEIYAQAFGNRHVPNPSDDSSKMFSLCDIDEIFEKIGNSTVEKQPFEETPTYNWKESLLEWAKEKAEFYKGTANIRRSFEMMIRKIESL